MPPYNNVNPCDLDVDQYDQSYNTQLQENQLDVDIREFYLIDRILCYENSRYYSIVYGIMEAQRWFIEFLPIKYQEIISKYMIVTDPQLKVLSYNELRCRHKELDKLNSEYEYLVHKLTDDIIENLSNTVLSNYDLENMSVYSLIELRTSLC